ncbi:MAG: hypothetical protein ACREJM_03090 [Candidatus Saccharimonadales bacterium]
MVDGVTSAPAAGYAALGVQPAESIPVSAPQQPPQQQQAVLPGVGAPVAAQAKPEGPTVDFSPGATATYVLDWRDPTTQQLLVQIPMRTALAQITGAQSVTKIGKTLDTEA